MSRSAGIALGVVLAVSLAVAVWAWSPSPSSIDAAEEEPLVTPEQLLRVMPKCVHPEYLPQLNAALQEYSINTPARIAAFLAQLAHESGELRYMEELASGAAYEGRKDLGNVVAGDGVRFKGRGPIQLTGRANYAAAGAALGLDLVNSPATAATPEVGFRIAGWYWKGHGLNELADQGPGSFDQITRRINGGLNGKAARDAYFAKATAALASGEGLA